MRKWINLVENAEPQFLYHGTWAGNLKSILRDGIRAPSYWGTYEVATSYRDQYDPGIIIRLPISAFDPDGLQPNEHLFRSLQDEDDETQIPKTWQASLEAVDSIVYDYDLQIDKSDVLDA